jgi:hypothetical protein
MTKDTPKRHKDASEDEQRDDPDKDCDDHKHDAVHYESFICFCHCSCSTERPKRDQQQHRLNNSRPSGNPDPFRGDPDVGAEFCNHGFQTPEYVVVLQPFPVRHVIEDAGYGADFCARTGHSMNQKTQGNSTHVDNLELHATHFILSRTLFTIKPGIYLPYFSNRREIDIYIHADGIVEVTGEPIQTDVVPILRDFSYQKCVSDRPGISVALMPPGCYAELC